MAAISHKIVITYTHSLTDSEHCQMNPFLFFFDDPTMEWPHYFVEEEVNMSQPP